MSNPILDRFNKAAIVALAVGVATWHVAADALTGGAVSDAVTQTLHVAPATGICLTFGAAVLGGYVTARAATYQPA